MTQITKEAIEAARSQMRPFIPPNDETLARALEAALPFLPIAGEGKVKALTKTQIETLANNIHNSDDYAYTIECLTYHLSTPSSEAALSAALSVPAAEVVGEPVGMGVFRNGEMIGFVGIGDEFKLPEDTDERRPIYAAPSATDGWQPIEAARISNGSDPFLAHITGHGCSVCYKGAGGFIYSVSSGKRIHRATHWRPLPTPPALGGKP